MIESFGSATGLSQQQLADLIGVTKASISHCETGRRTLANISLPEFFLKVCEKMVNRKISIPPCECLANEQLEINALLQQMVKRRDTLKREILNHSFRLEKMQEAYEQSKSTFDAISFIEAQAHEPENAERVGLWLDMTKAKTERQYKKNNRAQQEKITLHIAKMNAELEVCDKFIEEHYPAEATRLQSR